MAYAARQFAEQDSLVRIFAAIKQMHEHNQTNIKSIKISLKNLKTMKSERKIQEGYLQRMKEVLPAQQNIIKRHH